MKIKIQPKSSRSAFTLLELLTVMIVIAILVVMLLPVLNDVRARAEKVQCISNLRSLFVGANAYIQDNSHWPQIDSRTMVSNRHAYAKAWIQALKPYNISAKNWICPTVQRLLDNPDYVKPGNERVDYIATPFDDKHYTPFRFPHQPWFAERGSVHDGGNLLVFADGSVLSLQEVKEHPFQNNGNN